MQQALLKLLEGREVFVPMNVTQHWSKHDFVQVDTSDILFVCAGTFSDVYDSADEDARRSIGFDGAADAGRRQRVRHRELVEYGLIRELLGRLPVVVELAALGREELKRILVEPDDSIVREYRALLALDGIDLDVTDAALEALADHALERGYGARGLRSVIEELMRDTMFDAPGQRGERLVMDGAFVRERLAALDG